MLPPPPPRSSRFVRLLMLRPRAGLVAAFLFIASSVPDAARAQLPARDRAPGCQLQDARALEQFIDERFGRKLAELRVPGGVFVAVRDGRILLSKAYGVADLAHDRPVSAESTMFFVGSVSKPVTATAVMQLVEQGRLALDGSVNRYLDRFALDSAFPEPVRLWHVLTHTAGFDILHIGMAAHTRDQVEPLGEHLARRMPPRVDPPGVNYAYSNYGYGLLGHLVEATSGQSFPDYTRSNIFEPLGMRHSSFDAPYDDPRRAKSYEWDADRQAYRELPPAYFHIAPSVGLMASGHDMARFLIAHLNGGTLDGQRVLRPETAARMRALHYMLDPRLAGAGLGFRYQSIRGLRVIGHRGLVNEHTSILQFVPDLNAGYVVACNAQMCSRMEPLIEDLLEEFFCGQPLGVPDERAAMDLAALEGVYRPDRHSRRNIEKGRGMFDEFTIEAKADTLLVRQPIAYWRTLRFVPTAADALQEVGGEGHLLVRRDWTGEPRLYAGTRGLPLERMMRLPFWATGEFFLRYMKFAAAGLATAVIILPVAFLWRRQRDRDDARGVGGVATWTAWTIAALLLTFAIVLRSVLASRLDTVFMFGVPRTLHVMLWLPHAALVLTAVLLVLLVAVWRRGYWPITERLYVSGLAAGTVGLLAQLHYWNMLWFRY